MTNIIKLPFPLEIITLDCVKKAFRSKTDNNLPLEIMRVVADKGTVTVRTKKQITSNELSLLIFTKKGLYELTLNVLKRLTNKTDIILEVTKAKIKSNTEYIASNGSSFADIVNKKIKNKKDAHGVLLPYEICLYSPQHIGIKCANYDEALNLKETLYSERKVEIQSVTTGDTCVVAIGQNIEAFSTLVILHITPEYSKKIQEICKPISSMLFKEDIHKSIQKGHINADK